MEYLTLSGNNVEMGNIYPVTDGIRNGYDYDGPNSYSRLEFAQVPEFVPDLDGIKVKSNAILTDYISTRIPNPLHGLLVSARLYQYIQPYVDEDHHAFPATVVYCEKQFEYFWIHLCLNVKPMIDFKKSSFYFATIGGARMEKVEISSYEEYLLLNKENPTKRSIRADLINLKFPDKQYSHIFSIGLGGRYIVASSAVAGMLKMANFSGLLFSRAGWLVVEQDVD